VRLYTVSEVARLSGVSVRTLHHYDEVGLLKPAAVGANGYRHYGQDELLRLQQILFHREIGLRLGDIAGVLDAPDFDRAAALRAHRLQLAAQARRYRQLIRTIDETLAALEGATTMNDERIYRGFDLDEAEETQAEDWLRGRFGPDVQEHIDRSRRIGANWSAEESAAYFNEGRQFDAGVAKAMEQGLPCSSATVRDLVRVHCATVCRGWGLAPSKGACLKLAEIYREGPMFRDRFAEIAPGAAEYVGDAINAYAETELS
jgi:DNA-binding transcriptional MerR regulator